VKIILIYSTPICLESINFILLHCLYFIICDGTYIKGVMNSALGFQWKQLHSSCPNQHITSEEASARQDLKMLNSALLRTQTLHRWLN
jgi:hypothetical protein